MTAHDFREVDVPVAGGLLRAGVWEPVAPADDAPTVLLVHGVTSSHLAWTYVADRLPGVRVIAPDLRGRGRSNTIDGPSSLAAHADDLAALLTALGIERTLVVGHSMGGFVSIVFAHRHPERVSRVLLVDGGIPLDVPAGLAPEALVAGILGPTGDRLSMRFADVAAYLDFWKVHPAFVGSWTPELERYFAYDLVDAGDGGLRPATSFRTTAEDTADMVTGTSLTDALAGITHPVRLITVPRGLQNETPGLYAPEHIERMLAAYPGIQHERLEALNHYTIVMSAEGAEIVAAAIRQELAAAAQPV